jgi:hypothetical protein
MRAVPTLIVEIHVPLDPAASAARLARLDGVPPGVVAVVTDDAAPEFGVGRRVPLR